MDSQLLNATNNAASIYERLVEVETTLLSISQVSSDLETREELAVVCAKLSTILPLFDQAELLPLLSSQLSTKGIQSKVERLGLSKEVVRLSTEMKFGSVKICEQLAAQGVTLSPATIASFLRAYENSSYAEKIRTKNASIFNTTDQLESLLTIISTQLGKLSFSADPKQQENHRGYVSELRQAIKLAADLQQSVFKQMQETIFRQQVQDILINVCNDEQREEVLHRLQLLSATNVSSSTGFNTGTYSTTRKPQQIYQSSLEI
jgi:predicted RNA-binding protein YlxR (DUF448 family)